MAFALLAAPAGSQSPRAEPPFGGPIKPDRPLAQAYDKAARALADVDDNPVIHWAYRVWCETGYRTTREAGPGQIIDRPRDLATDLISPKGFLDPADGRPMPAGGVRFMDNAWYFGTDVTGMVVVRTPDGLVMFDSLTTPDDMQGQLLDQMAKAGLDPREVKYIFMGHWHPDHIGGANLIRTKFAPLAKFVMGGPDADMVMKIRAGVKNGQAMRFGPPIEARTPAQIEARKQKWLLAIPDRIDIRIGAYPGSLNGAQRIRVGPKTEVFAMLTPGHTDGQMTMIVPVVHGGSTHKLLVWSGNDRIERAADYAISSDFVAAMALREGADAFINTHAYQGAVFSHLRRLKADPQAPNPLLMGVEGVQRYAGVFAACQRAEAQRLKDGTWKAL
ncbi:MBL fold metallo-hydrolase [Sphingobium sp.]|uniref:MBL fold metallo-hydrolase n=1 Tax=Sphingobium sp. TaxID=1912891 RepID=UPI002BF17933|nr:MBL fold metallo-hydrolase [Sphingobium sp.]HUD92938.1 MBL fold metallo-hydrolase [Sphingobium sp.]